MRDYSMSNGIVAGLTEVVAAEQGKPGISARRHTLSIRALPAYHGDAIKQLRLRCHLSQKTFALALGVSVKTVEAWEAGRNDPAGPAQRMLSLLEMVNSLLEKCGIVSSHLNEITSLFSFTPTLQKSNSRASAGVPKARPSATTRLASLRFLSDLTRVCFSIA